MSRTLYDKLWDLHEVTQRQDGTYLLYIDRHLIHEVTSPQAFEGLRLAGRKLWRAKSNIATPDHNIPTTDRDLGIEGIKDEVAKLQVTTLDDNCKEHQIEIFDIRYNNFTLMYMLYSTSYNKIGQIDEGPRNIINHFLLIIFYYNLVVYQL